MSQLSALRGPNDRRPFPPASHSLAPFLTSPPDICHSPRFPCHYKTKARCIDFPSSTHITRVVRRGSRRLRIPLMMRNMSGSAPEPRSVRTRNGVLVFGIEHSGWQRWCVMPFESAGGVRSLVAVHSSLLRIYTPYSSYVHPSSIRPSIRPSAEPSSMLSIATPWHGPVCFTNLRESSISFICFDGLAVVPSYSIMGIGVLFWYTRDISLVVGQVSLPFFPCAFMAARRRLILPCSRCFSLGHSQGEWHHAATAESGD